MIGRQSRQGSPYFIAPKMTSEASRTSAGCCAQSMVRFAECHAQRCKQHAEQCGIGLKASNDTAGIAPSHLFPATAVPWARRQGFARPTVASRWRPRTRRILKTIPQPHAVLAQHSESGQEWAQQGENNAANGMFVILLATLNMPKLAGASACPEAVGLTAS